MSLAICFFFFFNDTATTEIYTLSLHDALPISTAPPAPRPRLLPRNGPPSYRNRVVTAWSCDSGCPTPARSRSRATGARGNRSNCVPWATTSGRARWCCGADCTTSTCRSTGRTGSGPTGWRQSPTGWVGWWPCWSCPEANCLTAVASARSVGAACWASVSLREVHYGQDQSGSRGAGRAAGGGGAEHRRLAHVRRVAEGGHGRRDAGARQATGRDGQRDSVVGGARFRVRDRPAVGVRSDPAAVRRGREDGGDRGARGLVFRRAGARDRRIADGVHAGAADGDRDVRGAGVASRR